MHQRRQNIRLEAAPHFSGMDCRPVGALVFVLFGGQIVEGVLQGSNTLLFGLLLGFARVLPGSQQAACAFGSFPHFEQGDKGILPD